MLEQGRAEGQRENLKQIPHLAWSLTQDSISQPGDNALSRNQESNT